MSTICGNDFNSLSQKLGGGTKLATKSKVGMFIRAWSSYNGSNHNIYKSI
jgi:hypothetical protein